MERLLEIFLGSGLKLPLFDPDLMALDRDLPKSELLALLLLERRGQASMSELAADLGSPLSTATGIGERLERRGLVERQRHSQDRRVVLVRLTPAGQRIAAKITAHMNSLFQRVQGALNPEEMAQLMALITKAVRALHPDRDAAGKTVTQTVTPGTRSDIEKDSTRRIPVED